MYYWSVHNTGGDHENSSSIGKENQNKNKYMVCVFVCVLVGIHTHTYKHFSKYNPLLTTLMPKTSQCSHLRIHWGTMLLVVGLFTTQGVIVTIASTHSVALHQMMVTVLL